MDGTATQVRTLWLPLYSEVRRLVSILDGIRRASVTHMISAIDRQTGTPKNPVNWSDPDNWVAQRLHGDDAELASRIWRDSQRSINPRYIYGSWLFINAYELLKPDSQDVLRTTNEGRTFAAEEPELIRKIDIREGVPQALSILSAKDRAKASDLLPEWAAFLRQHPRFGTPSTVKDSLRTRLLNLVDRGLCTRKGNIYAVSESGQRYLSDSPDPKHNVMQAVQAYNNAQRQELRKKLQTMSPHRFEHLVRELLEAIGYDGVMVTKESGDRGVDVVASVEVGITTVTEVVQVKRHQGSIDRPVLDALRGVLPLHQAIRGTLITVGKFSKGCKEVALHPGAAPITLIDGDRLLDLLVEHEVGVRKSVATIHEVDEDFFSDPTPGTPIDETLDDA